MAAFRLSRQLTLSQGDGLSQSKKNCFCLDFTDDPSTLFMRLGCNCVIHYHCLVQHLQHSIGDRINMNLQGISCPYGGECKSLVSGSDDSGGVYYVTLDDLDNIVEYGVSHPDLKGYLDEVGCEALTHEQVKLLKEWIDEQKNVPTNPRVYTDGDYELFIISTTKACPACGYRSTHYHGHRCHHIKCPNCRVEYCYKCLGSEVENRRDRGHGNRCRCEGANWINFCAPVETKADIAAQIAINEGGIPYDKRCGCVVCSDCRYRKPCKFCPGDCSVCTGHVNPSPSEVSQTWDPNGCAQLADAAMSLWECCRHGYTDRLLDILETISNEELHRKDRNGRNALDYAIDTGDIAVTQILISKGFDVNGACNIDGDSPLIYAVRMDNAEICRLLVEKGADIHAKDNNGSTPLLWATYNNYTELSVLLVEKGADVNARDNDGDTPLLWATENNNTELSVLLVEKGDRKSVV